MQKSEWRNARERIIQLVLSRLPGARGSDIVLREDQVLPIQLLKLSDLATIIQLRNFPEVRYLEPANYQPEELARRSDSGCYAACR